MRKISVLLFFASMMMAMPSQAQLVKFGVKGGLNLTKMDMDHRPSIDRTRYRCVGSI